MATSWDRIFEQRKKLGVLRIRTDTVDVDNVDRPPCMGERLPSLAIGNLIGVVGSAVILEPDVLLRPSQIDSAGIGAGHLLYDFSFLAKRKPSKKQLLSVMIAVVLTLIPLYFFRHLMPSALAVIGVIAYAAILFSTVIFSKPSGRLIFACASIFALSDLMLVFNIINKSGFFLTLVSLIVYYVCDFCCMAMPYGNLSFKKDQHPLIFLITDI